METLEILCPAACGPKLARGSIVPPSLASLAGRVVGIIDNSKPNFTHLADALEAEWRSRWAVARVVRVRKHSPAVGAEPEVLARLASECDLVVAGIGD